ncbi:metal ABC transporter solute-binding protein, Zn/Mn family [Planctomycetes bacterium CA13]
MSTQIYQSVLSRNFIATLFLFAITLFSISGCSEIDTDRTRESAVFDGEYPIAVTATVGMVADIVKRVGKQHVTVTQLMGAGVDPHLYNAPRDDVLRIMESDVTFYSGLKLEGKMADTLVKLANQKPVVPVTEQIDRSQLLEPESMHGHYDPHVWMDVQAWAKCVDVIASTLSQFDPQHSDDYRANADAYLKQLEELHAYGLKAIGSIPPQSRVLITSHDAFNYFGRAYGLEVLGVQGLSTESEAGLQRINELVNMIVERKIKAVFVESSVSPKNIRALIEGAAAQDYEVKIGGELFSDAMGIDGTYEGTYVGMLDHNITLVARELGGVAPPDGFLGNLAHAESRSIEKESP